MSESLHQNSPVIEEFAGESAKRVARRLYHATRPKFFPASMLPVIAGSVWGFRVSGSFDTSVFLLALIATLCVHAAANVLNDVGDDSGGTDRVNEDRIYPYTGGSRFIQAGILSSAEMARLGITLLSVASIAGLVLLWAKGAMILVFGIAGVALAVLYSLGPLRLSGLGIGEAAVAAGFGVLPVTGAAWLQSGIVDIHSFLYSLPVSAWVAAILLINEVPDINADGQTGKRTLPVRLGLSGTRTLFLALHTVALLAVITMTVAGSLHLITPIVPAVLLLVAYRASNAIRRSVLDREGMRKAIESTLAVHTIGTLWLSLAVFYSAWSTG